MANNRSIKSADPSPRRRFADNADALRRFEKTLKNEANAKWGVGDALVVLVDVYGYRIASLAKRYGRRRNTLSAYYHTAKAFSRDQRNTDIAFSAYDNARQASGRYGFSADWCLKQIVKNGLTQRRDVSRFFGKIRRERDNAAASRRSAKERLSERRLYNRCHYGDARLVAQILPSQSVKLANLDLPYGPYGVYADGKHDEHGLSRNDCDGNDETSVTGLLEDLLRILVPKMTQGGAVLLYRPGGGVDPLHSQIISSTEEHGWDIPHLVNWDKRRTKLGRATAPYTLRTERIYVLCRRGDQLINHDGSSRDDIVSIPAARYRRGDECNHHLFEKPLELCRYFLGKHTYEGELVFDACGCSGNMCIAAGQMNRRWVYCETNLTNYEWGSARIAEALKLSCSAVV